MYTRVARKILGIKKEPSSLERTTFLLRFNEHRDNSKNSQRVFLGVWQNSGTVCPPPIHYKACRKHLEFCFITGNAGTGKCQRGAFEHGCEYAPVAGTDEK